MSLSTRTTDEALAFARIQHESGSLAWKGLCQKFSRTAYGVGPLFSSAWANWLGTDPEDKHPGTNPDDAPVGSLLHFKGGSKGFGHIMPAARDFSSGRTAAWSNDFVVPGRIDKVHRDAPVRAWGQTYVGYTTAINDVDLRMPQKLHYGSLHSAIDRLGAARDTAVAQSDGGDVQILDTEIARLQKLYDTIRRHA
jgi:hypothetical protein